MELTQHTDMLMVPLMLVVAGATWVARCLELRSIYSARLHLGRLVAAGEKVPVPTAFDDLVSQDFEVVSSAEHYSDIAQRLLNRDRRQAPLYAVDELGRLVGEITPGSLSNPAHVTLPLETATAADLIVPVSALTSSMSKAEVVKCLDEHSHRWLPVVETTTRRLFGVVFATTQRS